MKHITVSAFQELLTKEPQNESIAYIDVCSAAEHNAKHIAGVKNIPLDELPSRMQELKDKKTIYIHCRSGNRSKRAIETLEAQGITADLINVEGGILAWEAAGLATHKTSNTLPLTQQVFIAAGTLILTGVLLTLIGGKIFLIIPAFVGGGLLFGGTTGWCGMAILLAKMPWNK